MKTLSRSLPRLVLLAITALIALPALAQKPDRVEPAFWWTGMKNPRLQILLKGKDIGKARASAAVPGIAIVEQKAVLNPDYLFLYLNISAQASPGKVPIKLDLNGKTHTLQYELKARNSEVRAQGYTQKDAVYLLMPDRFANGNPANDNVKGMLEVMDRKAPYGRHGGDLEGVRQHLDYIKQLGMTTIWINPVQENDMPKSSYHGYAITDFYAVDRRFGTMDEYRKLIAEAHGKGLKIVMDMVMNHIGTNHYLVTNPPDSTWVNRWPTFTNSNFRSSSLADPNAAPSDRKKMADGWFDNSMADVNQRNLLFADYLIQNCIWWVEHTNIDAIRMDTYPYPDQPFMNKWADAIMAEYPNFQLVGEVWVSNPALLAYYLKGHNSYRGWKSSLPSACDFPLRDAMANGVNEADGWDAGLAKVYNTLALDFLYDTPERNLVFAANHDMTRAPTAAKGDYAKYRQLMVMVATLRGVPQTYYGDEIFMEGDGARHSDIRHDFPGGWKGDSASVKGNLNLSQRQSESLAFNRRLWNWRLGSQAVTEGSFMQYVPENGIYVYFRLPKAGGAGKTTMVVLNGNDAPKELNLKRFRERFGNAQKATEMMTGQTLDLNLEKVSLPTRAAYILELE